MIWTRTGGADDGPLLVLLHGLGGTGELWRGLEALLPDAWAGGWVVPDLPGHGRSATASSYDFGVQAALVAEALPDDRDLVLVGHSMGGMVALAMAGRLDRVQRVVGFSIKTYWPAPHVEGMRGQSLKPARVFPTREEAVERYLLASGLRGLADPGAPEHAAGIREVPGADGGWRIAQDMGTFDFGVPDMPALLDDVSCPVTLARGSEDVMVREENYAGLGVEVVTWDGLGHNPHVEDPAAVVALL
ncbi:alpha/beta fold hydrolase [Nocardioides stalactiti]|uniref:alpha/beta fold hydrolase n=1 Tax=Nocardioides stalactiti TaxID=2755356 RepID=UPI001C80DF17|nr:alpha/beta hydrolase [Nocardioides stalactiti]